MGKLSYNDKLSLGPTELQNNVSKTSIVKTGQLSVVYNYRTLRHAMTKNDVISENLHFHFLGE